MKIIKLELRNHINGIGDRVMNWIKKSITRKIGAIIIVFVFTLLAIYYVFLNVEIKNYLGDQSEEQLMKDSVYLSTQMEMFLQKYIVIVDQAKKNPDFINIAKDVKDRYKKREDPLYKPVTNQLMDISKMDEDIALAYIAVSEADDLITNRPEYSVDAHYDLSKRQWYIDTIKQGKTVITEPYRDVVTGQMIITIASPMVENDKLYGVFGVDIRIEDIGHIIKHYNIGEVGYAILAYNNGQILYYPNYDINVSKNGVSLQDLLGDDITKEALSEKNGITSNTHQGKEEFVAFSPIRNTNLTLLTVIPKEEVFHKLNLFTRINLLILAGLIVAITMILIFLKNLISVPVIKISNEIDQYSKYDTNIVLSKKYLERKDEIGILSRGLSLMMKKISKHILEIEEKNQQISIAKEKISIEQILLKTTLHSIGDGVISTDYDGNIEIMNAMAENMTGWTNKEAHGLACDIVFNIIDEFTRDKCLSPVKQVFESRAIVELESNTLLIKKNGTEIPIEDSSAPIFDNEGNVTGAVVVFRDYTEKKEKQEKIKYLSYHDQMTGVYNRRFFEEELRHLDTERNLPFTFVMLDVNGLKLINDAFGHLMGDQLLKVVAETIKKECRDDDIIARIGGDEFVVLLPKTDYNEAELIVRRIYCGIECAKFEKIIISASIGWATKNSKEEQINNVFAKAEDHMYHKKLIESQSMRSKTLKIIIKTLNESNERYREHAEKVSIISRKIGQLMSLDQEVLKEIEIAGLMHDIGKIAIDSSISNKPDKLTKLEYEEIKRHSEVGYHILKSVDTYSNLSRYILSHHERWDGKGYPQGLKGKEIPLIARIITVADAYEAMIAGRPYRKSFSKEEAIQELKKCSGTQFDPEIILLCVDYI